MTDTLFHMWGRFRQSLIDGHNFYLEQAQKRLLSQFNNIEDEAEKYAEEWLEKVGSHFDPDRHDPSDFYEQAHEESIAFYQMLDDLRKGGEYIKGECYKFIDQDEGRVGYYTPEGYLLEERPMKPEERQKTIQMAVRLTGTDN